MLIDNAKKREEARSENSLMKDVKIKNEFLNEVKKKIEKEREKITESPSNQGYESIASKKTKSKNYKVNDDS